MPRDNNTRTAKAHSKRETTEPSAFHRDDETTHIGTHMTKTLTRDGFDRELVARCAQHDGVPAKTVLSRRAKDQRVRDELSGAKQSREVAKVTLPKFSWDEEEA